MSEHALLSPSGASRWLMCTPSARLEQLFNDSAGSAAEEGTLAHAVGELLLKQLLDRIPKKKFDELMGHYKTHPLYANELYTHAEDYAVFVMEKYAEAKTRNHDAFIDLEAVMNLEKYIPKGFGTLDNAIISDDILDINDLKYGKGVRVSAHENSQLKVYALGAIEKYSTLFDIKRVRMTIFQPRLDNIDTFEMPVEDLLKWGRDYLVPKAREAWAGDGPYQPGDHCRFCRAKTTCKANAEFNMEIAKFEFKQLDLLDEKEMVEIYGQYDRVKNWIESVAKYMLAEAVKGRVWPGLKVVEGKSRRKWGDTGAVIDALKEVGYEADQLYKPREIQGLTDMKALVGTKIFNKLLDPLCVKPRGAPSLAPVADPRPSYVTSASDDFANLILNDDE